MASSDRTPDMSRVIGDLSRAIHQLVDKVDNLGGTGRPGSGGGGRAKPNDLDIKSTQKDFKKLNDTIEATEKKIRDLRRGFGDSQQSLEHLYRVQNDAAKGIIQNQKLNDKAQQSLINAIDRSIKGHSFLGQSMANAGKKIEFLEQKLEETAKFLTQYGDILKETNAQSLSGITDHEALRKALTKLNKEMTLSEDVQEMIRKNEFARAAQALDNEAKNANTIRTSIRKTSTNFNRLDSTTKTFASSLSKAADTVGAGFVKEAAQWGGAMGLIVGGVKQAYSQFWSTASAGFGGAFIQLSKTAIGLGISLESLTRITKENMNLVGKMGLKGFNDSLKESQSQLMQLGLTTEEAAKARAVMNENAFLTGVDVKNKRALNAATDAQIAAYENMRAVTGESIEALAAQTKAILTDNDSLKIMGTMNKQQRVQMLQSINAERVRLTTMGLTNEAALGVIKSLQALQNMKATDRVEAGNKLMAAGSALGMDPAQAAKAAAILQKGRGATAEDKKFLADFAKEATAKQDKLQGGDLNDQMLANLTEDWTAALQPVQDGMRQANLDRGLAPAEVEANKAMGRVPKAIAEGSAKIETFMRVLESPLSRIAVGVLGIGALLLKHLGKKREKGKIPHNTGGANGETISATESLEGSVGARPGDSIQSPGRFDSQMTKIANKHGWTQKQYDRDVIDAKGWEGHKQHEKNLNAEKAVRVRGTKAGREAENNTSIGSTRLQELLNRNREMVSNRLVGPPTPARPRSLADRIDDFAERSGRRTQQLSNRARSAISSHRTQVVNSINGFGSRIGSRISESAPMQTMGAVRRVASKAVGSVAGGVGRAASSVVSKAAGSLMKFGAKAIPFLGIAVTAIEGLQGAFDGVSHAAEIFGVDTQKQSVTTSQKISAGIAGALNTLSFGLIPTDDTARLLNDVATDGVSVLTDYMEEAEEFIYNKAIPAVYSALKNVMGWIGGAIIDVLSPSTWIDAFNGKGDGGFVSTIISSLSKAVQFIGTALTKGMIKVVSDMVEGMVNLIPDWMGGKAAKEGFAKMKKESEKDGFLGFAETDTKFSDFDSPEEAKKRKEREAKKAARDKKSNGQSGNDNRVQGSPSSTTGSDNLGMVSNFGQELTQDQLAAQGVQGRPEASSTPGVNGPNGSAQQASQGGSSGSDGTQSAKDQTKSAEETLLTSILEKMTTLVDLTDKGYKLAQEEFKLTSTRERVGAGLQPQPGNGYSPSLAAFMNMPM